MKKEKNLVHHTHKFHLTKFFKRKNYEFQKNFFIMQNENKPK